MAAGEDAWQSSPIQEPSKPGTVTVAGKPSLDVPPGMLNSILKQAGLKRAEQRMTRYMVVMERGVTSWGAHVPEVLRLIREAIEFHIAGLKGDALPVPAPSSEGETVEVGAA